MDDRQQFVTSPGDEHIGRYQPGLAVIVGGGQSGSAAARALSELGVPALVLEVPGRLVRSWPQYDDSLRLFSPVAYTSMPGMQFPGMSDRYPGRDEVADYLERYAAGLTAEDEARIGGLIKKAVS
jgi:cation diffusion facilitator CzcD-associated flavoprotein CzcO